MHEFHYNDKFYVFQSGFKKCYSSETALINIVDQILSELHNDNHSGLLLGGFKEALDMINH